eukprot:CAMPEP_0168602110 /NCGR_PEP_ID=MMETSP0420-20121227/13846_1 /TAXON_ID=498008 /ORGANISM="Pessonella sp." /LENGTH=255 /DNA_ID=CAMNT_0008640653 /DNA_START=256 /DNA_END=1019 /DNA_ORIENTATION=+
MHVDSIEKATPKNLGNDVLPHYVTRRYAEWMSAAVALQSHLADDSLLKTECTPLILSMHSLLSKLAKSLPSPNGMLFEINNYALIVSLLEKRKAPESILNPPMKALRKATINYARKAATKRFPKLAELAVSIRKASGLDTKHSESKQSDDNAEKSNALSVPSGVTASSLSSLLESFQANYEQELLSLRDSTLQHFASFDTGIAVFSEVLACVYDLYALVARLVRLNFAADVRCLPERSNASVDFEFSDKDVNDDG